MADHQAFEEVISTIRTQSIGAPRYSRRLSDKIFLAFHHACDQRDYEIAERLLKSRLEALRNLLPYFA